MQETWETQVWSLGRKDLLEEGLATHSRMPAWSLPQIEEPGGLPTIGLQRAGHNWSDLAQSMHYKMEVFIFFFVFLVSLSFPSLSSHVWEDFFIFGSKRSKNPRIKLIKMTNWPKWEKWQIICRLRLSQKPGINKMSLKMPGGGGW